MNSKLWSSLKTGFMIGTLLTLYRYYGKIFNVVEFDLSTTMFYLIVFVGYVLIVNDLMNAWIKEVKK